jgi:hypothetical protein
MPSIWKTHADKWRRMAATALADEATLHDRVVDAPKLLTLSGLPRSLAVGREVALGGACADLLAVDQDAQIVAIETKLARDADARRAVIARILACAAALMGSDRAHPMGEPGSAPEPCPGLAVRALSPSSSTGNRRTASSARPTRDAGRLSRLSTDARRKTSRHRYRLATEMLWRSQYCACVRPLSGQPSTSWRHCARVRRRCAMLRLLAGLNMAPCSSPGTERDRRIWPDADEPHTYPRCLFEHLPAAWVWNQVKQRISKQSGRSKAELEQRVLATFRPLQRLPDQIRGFLRDPSCAYAAAT